MNQTQVNNFLQCLLQINDLNYLALHARATAATAATVSTLNKSAVALNISNDNNDMPNNSSYFLPSATTYSSSSLTATNDDRDHDHDHDPDHDHNDSFGHDLMIAKVTAMVVLFCASALCGSIPFMLNRCFKWTEKNTNARSATVVKCLLYFGGGVLLCTTFLHLLPEVQEIVEQLQKCNIIPELTFPLAELLMCAGFFLMYFIEEVIHTYIHRHNQHLLEKDAGAGAAFERGHSVRNSYLVKGGQKSIENNSSESEQPLAQSPTSGKECAIQRRISSGGILSVQDLISHDIENQKYQLHEQSLNMSTNNSNQFDHHQHQQNNAYNHYHQHQHQHVDHQYKHNHDHHSHLPPNSEKDMIASSIRGLFIVLALSLHELFEGMAIGLEGSASSVWFMFGAVSAHKLVLAFCVGVELIVARTRIALCIVYVMTFAIVSPIGIGIGILISYSGDKTAAPTIPSAILQGMACGTLLYVVFFEILSKNRSGLLAYLALFVGFAVMFGLQQLVAGGHGHSHGNCESLSGEHDHDARSLLMPEIRGIQPHTPIRSNHLLHKHHLDEQQPNDSVSTVNSFENELQALRYASEKLLQNNIKI